MAGQKDHSLVMVINSLTKKQAADLQSRVIKGKQDIAPNSRGTAEVCKTENVGRHLQQGVKRAQLPSSAKGGKKH
jgi:hypothetical protein